MNPAVGYDAVLSGVSELLESARRTTVRATNAIMTATYWEIGRRIVEYEQRGKQRAEYGETLLKRLSVDLTKRFGRGFGLSNLKQIRKFYLNYEDIGKKGQTASGLFYIDGSVNKGHKDPFMLEFLGLKDEYSESDLEGALISQLENFLLELGSDFTFVGRQRRLRVGNEWYRVDLLFYHRRLRCLVIIDLKLGKFTHADAGQMHLYLNYAREHWTHPGENPPAGLILCAQKDHAVAKYALEGLPNKVLAAEYKTVLPDEKTLAEEIERSRKMLERRGAIKK